MLRLPTYVKYIDGELAMNDTISRTLKTYGKVIVNTKLMYESIQQLFYKFIAEDASGIQQNPTEYKWDLYDYLDLPKRSVFRPFDPYDTNSIGTAIQYRRALNFSYAPRALFQRMNSDATIQNAFCEPQQNGYLKFLSAGHPQQVMFDYISKGDRAKSYFSDTMNSAFSYKIHLSPKSEYLLYTLCRLFTIMKDSVFFTNKLIRAKFLFSPRDSFPETRNTKLTELNGGAAPTIVIYWNNNAADLKEALELFLQEFKRDEPIIGQMTVDYAYRVLPFNVRLNSLLLFAQGDRISKLTNREKQRTNGSLKQYFMADWVKRMIEKCGTEDKQEDIANLSMQLLGKNICLPEVQESLSKPECLDDICWMTADPKNMFDPTTLENLELEPESRGDVEEADTSANNLVIHPDLHVARIEAGQYGGKKRKQTKKRRSTRRQSTRRIRKSLYSS